MYAALAVVALTMNVSTSKLSPNPVWLDSYKVAQERVAEAGKPMAVFVGTGKSGWAAAVRDGFDPSISKLLAEKFVCLYADVTTPAGKSLAAALQLGERGVVLSDSTGQIQLFSVAGTVSRDDLGQALVAYADDKKDSKNTDKPAAGSAPQAGTAGGTVITGPGAGPGPYVGGGAMMGGPGGPVMGGPGFADPGPAMGGPVGGPAPYGYGYGGGCCGKSYGYGGGCCGKGYASYGGGCCGKSYGYGGGCCGKSYGGGCCGWGGGYGGGCCGKGYGGYGYGGGCCSKGYGYGYGGGCCK